MLTYTSRLLKTRKQLLTDQSQQAWVQWWEHSPSTNVAQFWFRPRRHAWVEFVGFLLCTDRFSPGYSGFPPCQKPKLLFDLLWFSLMHNLLKKIRKATIYLAKFTEIIIIIIVIITKWFNVITQCLIELIIIIIMIENKFNLAQVP